MTFNENEQHDVLTENATAEIAEISEEAPEENEPKIDPVEAPVPESDPVEQSANDEPSAEEETNEAAESEADALPDLETIKALKAELEELKRSLEESRAFYARLEAECSEFSSLYPDVALSSLPDSVWQGVKNGIPLAAAYALDVRRTEREAELAGLVNAENKKMSSGALSSDNKDHIFSPTQVKAMTREEIRANYSQIVHSMKKWN